MTPVSLALIVIAGGVFVLQTLSHLWGIYLIEGWFALSVAGFKQGAWWQFVTYIFLHGSIWHLLLNMLVLFFFGPELERALGRPRFLLLFFSAGILGGAGWLALIYPYESMCLGASGAIFGLLGAFAALYPNREITLLLFFVLPITLKAWVLVGALGVIQLFMVLQPGPTGVAYSAHLAGGLAGFVYGWMLRGKPFRTTAGLQQRWNESRNRRMEEKQAATREEVDRLLDKIAEQGIHSLTPRERKILEESSRRYPR